MCPCRRTKTARRADERTRPDPRDQYPLKLVAEETTALRRLSPSRNRCPELAEYDRRISELGIRRQEVGAAVAELRESIPVAEDADRARLADWLTAGKGERPQPSAPVLEERLRETEAELDGLRIAEGSASSPRRPRSSRSTATGLFETPRLRPRRRGTATSGR